jgi:thiamine-phosphate pyrophosphorylase
MAFTTSRKKLLKESRLYLILDRKACASAGQEEVFRLVKNKCVDIVQLRDKYSSKIGILKQALQLKALTEKQKVIFIVNDFADIAKITGADGVHIGRMDTSIRQARELLGPDKIIGVTCRSLRQARTAKVQGADYISVGPVFHTSTKRGMAALGLGLLRKIRSLEPEMPLFAIGGINRSNLNLILESGVRRIAVCGAICRASVPSAAARELKSQLLRAAGQKAVVWPPMAKAIAKAAGQKAVVWPPMAKAIAKATGQKAVVWPQIAKATGRQEA